MFKIKAKVKRQNFPLFTFYSLVLAGLLCAAGTSNAIEGAWDPAKYIGIDEIRPGMKAYCLTCFTGTKIEKFELDVISIIRNYEPGRDSILVQGTDERFIHTGPVWGCSGSPVYIEGRLAGAL
ncbi:MAG: SpoIVB peptidase S55 domain-containing protein, partial [Planctomycetota bacterium]